MNFVKRLAVYALGMALLAMGITLNTKTGLGVSPLVSVAFCISELKGFSFGNAAMVAYLIYFVIEAALKGRSLRPFDFLQIPFCYVFSRCMNLFSAALPMAEAVWLRIVMLALGIVCTGFGAAIMVAMRLIPNPADGLTQILGVRLHKSMGFAKNLFDAVSVCITLAIGLIGAGRIVGVGVGTVCAVLGTGRAVALCNRLFGAPLARVLAAAPIRAIGESAQEQAAP